MLSKDLVSYNKKLAIIQLREQGHTLANIAETIGCSVKWVAAVVDGGRSDAEVALATRKRLTRRR